MSDRVAMKLAAILETTVAALLDLLRASQPEWQEVETMDDPTAEDEGELVVAGFSIDDETEPWAPEDEIIRDPEDPEVCGAPV